MEQTPSTPYKNLVLERTNEAGIVILRIVRPQARNAINRETMHELDTMVTQLQQQSEVRCLIVGAESETTFIAGGDLKDFAQLNTPEQGKNMGRLMQNVLEKLANLPIPSIAAIGGDAYGGGCEVALACDLRVMAEDAHLVFSQVRLGLTTGWGGGPRLVQMVGPAVAMRILLTGESVSATEAKQLGLVAAITPRGQVMPTAIHWAKKIVQHPKESIGAMKQVVHQSAQRPLEQTLQAENQLFGQRWASPQHQAAVARFLTRKQQVTTDPEGGTKS